MQNRLKRGQERIAEAAKNHGLRGAVSEALYLLAVASAHGPHNSAAADIRKVRKRLEELKEERKRLRAELSKMKEQRATLRERIAALANKCESFHARITELTRGNLAFYEAQSLAQSRCPLCLSAELSVAPYPYAQSAGFLQSLSVWCKGCGFGWAAGLPFPLGEYYATQYAQKNRGDRELEPAKYFELLNGKEDELPGSLKTYVARAKQQIAEIERLAPPGYAILDYGSGPGYALHFSSAGKKSAVEPDQFSQPFLRYLGAEVLAEDALGQGCFDVVLSSHSLEHVLLPDVWPTLMRLRDALSDGGLFYCEVPFADLSHIHLARRHEPHTLFFGPDSLRGWLEMAGFDVLEWGACGPVRNARPLVGEAGTQVPSGAIQSNLRVIARKSQRPPMLRAPEHWIQPHVAVPCEVTPA